MEEDSTTQQTPTPKLHKHFVHKKRFIIWAIIIILLIGGAASGWWFVSGQKALQKAQLTEDINKKTKRAEDINQTISDAENLAYNGDINGAKAVYDDAIKNTEDSYKKSILLLSKATLSFNNGEYDDALAVAKEAETANQNNTVTQFIAEIYEKKGDNPKAIEYYQKTILLVDKLPDLADADIQYYQSRIDALSGE